jgi:hypothetical protein
MIISPQERNAKGRIADKSLTLDAGGWAINLPTRSHYSHFLIAGEHNVERKEPCANADRFVILSVAGLNVLGQCGVYFKVGDYDGDYVSELAVYRPSNRTWWMGEYALLGPVRLRR